MQIIPVASGKGGVGKSLLAANLAIALGKAGKRVILVDMDLGASNLHLVLGHQSPRIGMGAYLTGNVKFQDIIIQSDYENVLFIPGDSEIPGLAAIKPSQRNDLIHQFQNCKADFLIIDLGAGTHLTILDLFLLSPQGIIVSAPTVTATLNGYLFLKNAVFRLMYSSFPKGSKAYQYLEKLRQDSQSLQKIYIPNLIKSIQQLDPNNARIFTSRINQFVPRLVMNMIDDPKDAEKIRKIQRSCKEYLGIDTEPIGIIYRDSMQDKALAARLPILIYKPQSVLSQAIYRIADKILQSETKHFDKNLTIDDQYQAVESEANEDYESKLSYIEDLIGTGALNVGELADTIKSQQYEITQLKKENLLLKSKIIKATQQGFKV